MQRIWTDDLAVVILALYRDPSTSLRLALSPGDDGTEAAYVRNVELGVSPLLALSDAR